MLQRAGPCRCRIHFYLWRSSSRAAQRSRCLSAAAMDKNALPGNHLQRKEKERDSWKLFHWVFTRFFTGHSAFHPESCFTGCSLDFSLDILLFILHFSYTNFTALLQLLSKDWGVKSVQAKTLSLVPLTLDCAAFVHVRLSANSRDWAGGQQQRWIEP